MFFVKRQTKKKFRKRSAFSFLIEAECWSLTNY